MTFSLIFVSCLAQLTQPYRPSAFATELPFNAAWTMAEHRSPRESK